MILTIRLVVVIIIIIIITTSMIIAGKHKRGLWQSHSSRSALPRRGEMRLMSSCIIVICSSCCIIVVVLVLVLVLVLFIVLLSLLLLSLSYLRQRLRPWRSTCQKCEARRSTCQPLLDMVLFQGKLR